MQHKTRFTFCVFLLLLLTAGTCPAITIPSYDGTQNLSPAQIDDIIVHSVGGPDRYVKYFKDSLFLFDTLKGPGQDFWIHPCISSFNANGSHATALEGRGSKYQLADYFAPYVGRYTTMAGTVLSTKYDDTTSFTLQHFTPNAVLVSTCKGGVGISSRTYDVSALGLNNTASDIKAGMTVPGFDGEVIAFCTREWEAQSWGGSLLAVRVNFAEVHADD
ncbi:MAG: hypothetical protein IJR63_00430 [Synergistaceae bacterium]|nr:hypothetical protein [Synergistaceae bacterium]